MLPHIPAVFDCKRTSSSRLRGQTATALIVGLISIAASDVRGQQPAQPPRPSRPSPPPPDIYLASLTVERGSVTVGTPLNITDRAGYDNQPSFTSDGTGVFFTSVREDAQADIYRYDVRTKATTRVTSTAPESEYSATPVDADRAISVVRVERDSTQRLWRFPLDRSAPSVILERVRPVGYHAWANEHTLALFVLGSPNTLQLAGHAKWIRRHARNRNRALSAPDSRRGSNQLRAEGLADRVVDRGPRSANTNVHQAGSTSGRRGGLRVAAGRIDHPRARLAAASVVEAARRHVAFGRRLFNGRSEGHYPTRSEPARRPCCVCGRRTHGSAMKTARACSRRSNSPCRALVVSVVAHGPGPSH